MVFYALENITVIFLWDPPLGVGDEAVVDNYVITISPRPLSHNTSIFTISPPLNVTIDYNVRYTARIVAVNCYGESDYDSTEIIGKHMIARLEHRYS